mmetsp:Transcript_9077/g.15770  ORF Transcript_9077/g.15770 Transcript_9077/m.15770 type:complete len:284 (+) Transcript_9077:934-1785(+)
MFRDRDCQPNRFLLAIAGLLAIMAVSITLAVMFPYEDTNAELLAAAELEAEMEAMEVESPSVVVADDEVVDDSSDSSVVSGTVGVDNEMEASSSSIILNDAPEDSVQVDASEPVVEDTTKPKGQLLPRPDTEEKESDPAPSHITDHLSNLHEIPSATNDNNVIASKEREGGHCKILLDRANVNSDNILDTTEYMTLLREVTLTSATDGVQLSFEALFGDYASLPAEFQTNYEELSCICPLATPGCCDASKGIYIGEDLDEETLSRICAETEIVLKGEEAKNGL